MPAEGFSASDAFMYACHRCLRCCSHKRIHVNPYEVYRLARHLGMSTTEFLTAHTICGGTELARREDERCVFLTENGCGVHADRPLVCRLYPLGRHVVLGDTATYHLTETHPESAGVFGETGTVESFLASQGAGPFEEAADRYFALLLRISAAMAERTAMDPQEYGDASEVLSSPPERQHWLDIDAVAQSAGDDAGEFPSPEIAMAWHIARLEHEFLATPVEATSNPLSPSEVHRT